MRVLYNHLLDQFLWELLSGEEVMHADNELLALAAGKYEVPSPVIARPELQDFIQAWVQLSVEVICSDIP